MRSIQMWDAFCRIPSRTYPGTGCGVCREESRRFSGLSPEHLVPFLEMEKPKEEGVWVGRKGQNEEFPFQRGVSDILSTYISMPKMHRICEWALKGEVCKEMKLPDPPVWTLDPKPWDWRRSSRSKRSRE